MKLRCDHRSCNSNLINCKFYPKKIFRLQTHGLCVSAAVLNQLRPRLHISVFKRKRSCFAPDTAIDHSTTPTENDYRKRSHSKTLSRVERFENDTFWKRCFVVWTKKTMLSENGDVDGDATGRQTTPAWVSQNGGQMLLCGFNFAPISRADTLKCTCLEFIWPCALRV